MPSAFCSRKKATSALKRVELLATEGRGVEVTIGVSLEGKAEGAECGVDNLDEIPAGDEEYCDPAADSTRRREDGSAACEAAGVEYWEAGGDSGEDDRDAES